MEKIKGNKLQLSVLAVLYGLAVGLIFYLWVDPIRHGANYHPKAHRPIVEEVDPASLRLYQTLKNASMDNRTVILTTLNEAWAQPGSIFDLFLEAFRIGEQTPPLLNHLVVIAVDEKAMNRCRSMHPHCYLLTIDGVDLSGTEKIYMTEDYLTMMWERTHFLGKVLELGFSFILTDLDIIWFRTPFPHLAVDHDFTFSCDMFNGNASDPSNLVNGGYVYVRSSNRTITFYRHWYRVRTRYPGKHEQAVFNLIKTTRFVQRLGLRMRFLDTAIFAGFCQHADDLSRMCTLHANCCVGLQNKIQDLTTVLDIWRNFTSIPEEKRSNASATWEGPVRCKYD